MKNLVKILLVTAPLTVSAVEPTPGGTHFSFNPSALADFHTIHCGPASKNYSIEKDILPTDITLIDNQAVIPINTIITADGDYFCVLTASNDNGTSPYSPELAFFLKNQLGWPLGIPDAVGFDFKIITK